MTWGRLDDKLHENAKVWEAQTASMGLWVLANSWCCDNPQTAGFIPVRVLRRWSDASINDDIEGTADLLVDSGLWHHATQGREAGYLFHDWHEYRPESARSSYDARRGNHVRWHANLGVVKPDCEFCAPESESPSQPVDDRGDIGATLGRLAPESLPVPVPVPVPNKPCASGDAPERFEEFWDTYDKKRDRKTAERKYRLALKKRGVTADLLISSARSYIAFQKRNGQHPQFTKDPATWLNNESWNNELISRNATTNARTEDYDPFEKFAALGRMQSQAAMREQRQ